MTARIRGGGGEDPDYAFTTLSLLSVWMQHCLAFNLIRNVYATRFFLGPEIGVMSNDKEFYGLNFRTAPIVVCHLVLLFFQKPQKGYFK